MPPHSKQQISQARDGHRPLSQNPIGFSGRGAAACGLQPPAHNPTRAHPPSSSGALSPPCDCVPRRGVPERARHRPRPPQRSASSGSGSRQRRRLRASRCGPRRRPRPATRRPAASATARTACGCGLRPRAWCSRWGQVQLRRLPPPWLSLPPGGGGGGGAAPTADARVEEVGCRPSSVAGPADGCRGLGRAGGRVTRRRRRGSGGGGGTRGGGGGGRQQACV